MGLCDDFLCPYYGQLPYQEYELLSRSVRQLENNRSGLYPGDTSPWLPLRGIKPNSAHFKGVWNWDSAFHAMAVCRWDVELAREQVRIFLNIQGEDGMFPDVWRMETNEIFRGCSKPPVFPWAVWELEKQEHNETFLQDCRKAFRKNLEFWYNRRGGAENNGLCHYDGESKDPEERQLYGGWESGWDNSPRWDNGIQFQLAVDLNCYLVIAYRAMAHFARLSNDEADAADWQQKADSLAQKIEETFWDEQSGCYFDYDIRKKDFTREITPASFMPLFLGTASPGRAEKMAEIARKHMMPHWPSVSYHSAAFDSDGYWRGRAWLNIAYFALKGLKMYGYDDIADEGRRVILDRVARSAAGPAENYDPVTGEPRGLPHFSWSAVFCIKFLQDWNTPEIFNT